MSIADASRPSIQDWLGRGATAWRAALEPLTRGQRRIAVETL